MRTFSLIHRVWILAFLLVWMCGLANAQQPPTELEIDFWKSAQQLGTVEAYNAYLERFPNGFFAKLASAGIAKSTPRAASAPISTPSKIEPPQSRELAAAAASIAGSTRSSAVTLQLGDIFSGPGPITVGWLGAKKQLVLPPGRWVVVAANDRRSSSGISMTDVGFARIVESRLHSFFVAVFNSRPAPAGFNWTDAQACDKTDEKVPFKWAQGERGLNQCITSRFNPTPRSMDKWTGDFWQAVRSSLMRMNISGETASAFTVDFIFTGDLGNVLKVTITDFDATSQSQKESASPATAVLSADQIERKKKWSQAYARYAGQGYRKELKLNDLVVGEPATDFTMVLQD